MSAEQHRININRQKERVVFDMKDLIAGTEALLRSTASYTGAEIEQARASLKEQLELAQQQASQWNQLAKDRYRDASDATDEYVHDHIWGLLGAAAVAGLVIGVCLGSDKCRG
ncbi:DUF883 domain-containing protein [Paralcaligenes sp. KSB-10]|uniref:DUF883 family protein n=1 Tax=Paralcaligenes sp. KSB-10 TaxID=2901142 RepID=UPI001E4B89BB|nr:DUF883 domain-containing protein [Paralcaligenes sp. KSB-10]UHL64829.1 DUF883 domain-containing protein [Paralcaligenes sp. KSB-10]